MNFYIDGQITTRAAVVQHLNSRAAGGGYDPEEVTDIMHRIASGTEDAEYAIEDLSVLSDYTVEVIL